MDGKLITCGKFLAGTGSFFWRHSGTYSYQTHFINLNVPVSGIILTEAPEPL